VNPILRSFDHWKVIYPTLAAVSKPGWAKLALWQLNTLKILTSIALGSTEKIGEAVVALLYILFFTCPFFSSSVPMDVQPTAIPDVLLITPTCFKDDRGFFMESYNHRRFQESTGLTVNFVQDNHSRSSRGVLRGLHYQVQQVQGKLIRVTQGEIFDVAVDLRSSSPTFGQWTGAYLSDTSQQQLWIPPGFAHGFYTVSDVADVLYKATGYYAPEYDRSLLWNDPTIAIEWPLSNAEPPLLSPKDERAKLFAEAEYF
jgi:dTDP-4-dehydrorhamnose 3,5-epimerase